MKSLKEIFEGVLSDIEDTVYSGDKYLSIEDEIHDIQNFKKSRWKLIQKANPSTCENAYYEYTWKCPAFLSCILINMPDAVGIKYMLFLVPSESKPYTYQPFVDCVIVDNKGNEISNEFNFVDFFDWPERSQPTLVKRVSDAVSNFDKEELLKAFDEVGIKYVPSVYEDALTTSNRMLEL